MELKKFNTKMITNIFKTIFEESGYHGIDVSNFKFILHYKADPESGFILRPSEVYADIVDAIMNYHPIDVDLYLEYELPNGDSMIACELIYRDETLTCYTIQMFEHYTSSGDDRGDLSVEDYDKIINMDKLISKI